MNPEPEARHAWRFYRAGLGLRRADETVADLRGQHQAGVGRSPVHQLRGWLCQHPRDFLPRDRQSRGLLFRPGQLLDPAAQPVRLSPESSLPALEFLDQRARPRPPSPANAGRGPSRRSAGHPVKPLARTPFRRAAPKSFWGCSGAETKSGPGRGAQVGQGPGRHQEVLAVGGVQELVEGGLRARVEVEVRAVRVLSVHRFPGPVEGVAGGGEDHEMQAGGRGVRVAVTGWVGDVEERVFGRSRSRCAREWRYLRRRSCRSCRSAPRRALWRAAGSRCGLPPRWPAGRH